MASGEAVDRVAPESRVSRPTRARTVAWIAIGAFWALNAVGIVLEPRLPPRVVASFEYQLATMLFLLACMVTWVEADAVARDHTIRKWLRYLIIFVGFVGIPVYIVRSRGWRGLILFVLRVSLCAITCGAATWIAEVAIQRLAADR